MNVEDIATKFCHRLPFCISTRLPLPIFLSLFFSGYFAQAHTFTTLHSFSGGSDGGSPYAGLILSGNTLYGTTQTGDSPGNYGTVFAINTDGSHYATLHNFTDDFVEDDGAFPMGGLTLSGNTLYGTTWDGGQGDYGIVFSVNTDGTGFANLHDFNGWDGTGLAADLILSGNALYGTTTAGGTNYGTIFSVNTDGTSFTNLYFFLGESDEGDPCGGLVLSGDALYGTTAGYNGNGTIFVVNTDSSGFSTIYSFSAIDNNGFNSDGAFPAASLSLSGSTLYGTAAAGGNFGHGTVFAVNTDGSGFKTLHSFNGVSDGDAPTASLILSGNTLYGTTQTGGSSNYGTIFSVNIDGTGFKNLYSFTGNEDGANPQGGLVLTDNILYGTAAKGGSSGHGTVFSFSLGSSLPSLLTLANLCNNIYNGNSGYGDYTFVGNNYTLLPGTIFDAAFQAGAYTSSDQSQVVIAFRGTMSSLEDDVSTAETIKTLVTDVSFGGSTPNNLLQEDIADAVEFLQKIEQQYPNATITLTGHSLGGTIAQLVGQASYLSTVAFNAPGGQSLYSSLSGELQVGTWPGFNSTTSNINYRINGDQFSLLGTAIGSIVTIAAPSNLIWLQPTTGNLSSVLMAQLSNIGQLHAISTVITQIADNAQQVPGAIGPNLAGVIQDAIQPESASTVSPIIYKFLFNVLNNNGLLIDPALGTDFLFTNEAGSPSFASIVLPVVLSVSSYDLRYKAGNSWSGFQPLQPGMPETFSAGVDGIEFVAVDSSGNAVTISNFLFSASFASTGTFAGTLTESSVIPPLLPVLKISLVGNQVNLSWNTNVEAGFTLVTTTNFAMPIMWASITNTPIVVNNQNVVAIPMSSTSRFFWFRTNL